MAFNINAQVILSGPKNLKTITKKIEAGLSSVSTPVSLKMDKGLTKQIQSFNRNLTNLNRNFSNLQNTSRVADTAVKSTGQSLKKVSDVTNKVASSQKKAADSFKKTGKAITQARSELQLFGKDAALALRRFAGFTIATTVVFGFTRAVGGATKAALEFQRELVKVIQITGAGKQKMASLTGTINQLSVSLGLDANELLSLAKTFAQTGQTIDQVRNSMKAVARSSLTPTFGSMRDTTEGLIAAMAQFGIQAEKAESVLASMNAVSKKFAVEAEDLVSVIRRAGGVFSTAAGQMKDPQEALNELIGIFTAVRSTTRESAETIAVGLRTIFTRIQRGSTIKFLKQFNIELVNAKGNFIGLFPAFEELSRGLDSIMRSGDALTLSAITEELGGVRQVGKLIPAIKEFNKALEATEIAGEAAKKGLGKDVQLALQPVAKQFEVLKQRFNAFIREVASSKTFQSLAKTAISIANAFLSVAESLKPLIPLITTIATVKLTKGAFQFGAGFFGGLRKGGGAEGAGGGIASAITGGTRRGEKAAGAEKGGARAAVQSNTDVLKTANISIKALGDRLSDSITALQTSTTQSLTRHTQFLGAVGNLINALNRSGGGRGGFPAPRKFARGGVVNGPSHARGGVLAELEGGETVIPKGYAGGGAIVQLKPGAVGGFFLLPASGQDPAFGMDRTIKTTNADSKLEKAVLNKVGKTAKDTPGTAITRSSSQWTDLEKMDASWVMGGNKENITRATMDKFASLSAEDQLAVSQTLTGMAGKPGNRTQISPNLSRREGGVPNQHGLMLLKNEILKGPAGGGVVSTDTAHLDSITIQGQLQGFTTSKKDLGKSGPIHKRVADKAVTGIKNAVNSVTRAVHKHFPKGAKFLKGKGGITDDQLANIDMNAVEGYILEGLVENLTGAGLAGKEEDAAGNEVEAGFDFPNVSGASSALNALFQSPLIAKLKKADAKRQATSSNKHSIGDKVVSFFQNKTDEAFGKENPIVQTVFRKAQKKAAGGNIFGRQGTDTVPAMLTPGEFVINRRSAQKIGYGKLGKMNQYARGGVVGYENGAKVAATGAVGISFKGMETADDKAKELARGLRQLGVETVDAVRIVGAFRTAVKMGATNADALAESLKGENMIPGDPTSLPIREKVKARAGVLPKAQSTKEADARKRMEKLSKIWKQLTIEAEDLGKALEKGEITMDEYAQKVDIVERKQKKLGEVKGMKKTQEGKEGPTGTEGLPKAKKLQSVRDVKRQLSPEAIRKVVTGKGKKTNEQLVEGVGSAVTAVAGFTAAIQGFDIKHPMASLLSLGYAAQQASIAIKAFGGADVMGNLMKKFKTSSMGRGVMGQIEGIKKAPGKLFKSIGEGVAIGGAARGGGPRKGLKKFTGLLGGAGAGLKGFKKSLLKNFSATSLKGLLAKGFTGIPGLITALVGTMIIGPIAKKISTALFGKKETIEGTDIEGVKGGGTEGAIAGALDESGKAAGAGLALLALGSPLMAGIAAAFFLVKGAVVGFAKQMEFVAFKALQKSVREAEDAFKDFSKITELNAIALSNLNDVTEKVNAKWDASFAASVTRERTEQGFTLSGFFGKGGTIQSLVPGSGTAEHIETGGFAQQNIGGEAGDIASAFGGPIASMAAGAAAGAAIGALALAWTGPGALVGAAIGAIVGGLIGLGAALFTSDKRLEATTKAFDKAAKAITPEFLEKLDKAWDQTLKNMMGKLEVFDEDLIGRIATQPTQNTNLDRSSLSLQERATAATREWDAILNQAEQSLGGATGTTRGFVEELRRFQTQRMDLKLLDTVVKEADLMGDEGAARLKAGFSRMRQRIKRGDGELISSYVKRQKDYVNSMKGIGVAQNRALRRMIDQESSSQCRKNEADGN